MGCITSKKSYNHNPHTTNSSEAKNADALLTSIDPKYKRNIRRSSNGNLITDWRVNTGGINYEPANQGRG